MPGATGVPERRYAYAGRNVDGDRWSRFRARPDDVFICTPVKCGTTWMQAICALLLFQTPDLDFNPAERSPWLDSRAEPVDAVLARLDAQTGRRVIKTHTPLDGLPFVPGATYITVYRDPRDAFLSMRGHIENFKLDTEKPRQMEIDAAFRAWVTGPHRDGAEAETLAGAVHHLRTFLEFRDRPEIHVFHYADLKRDLAGQMRRVARVLSLEIDASRLAPLVRAASFEHMKRRAKRFVPGVSLDAWHDPSNFLRRGTSGQWRDGVLSDEVLRIFERELDSLVGPGFAAWLTRGGSLPAG